VICHHCRRHITVSQWVRLTGRHGNLWFHVACFYRQNEEPIMNRDIDKPRPQDRLPVKTRLRRVK